MPLSLSVASGPYTPDQNLDFEPFLSIIEEAKNSRPSVLLLVCCCFRCFSCIFVEAKPSSLDPSSMYLIHP